MNNEEKILQMLERMDERQNKTEAMLERLQAEMADGFEKMHGDIGNLQESSDKNMKIIKEGLPQINDRYAQLDKVEKSVDDHGNRLFALEQKVSNG